jgi:hypothetical protein
MDMNSKSSGMLASAQRLIIAVFVVLILTIAGSASAQAGEQLYPPPPTPPPTEQVQSPRPPAEVPPGDLARTGLDLRAPLALGALLVVVGGAIVSADRWNRRRHEQPAQSR